MLPQHWLQSRSIDLYTDASGTLGYGAVLGPQWLFGPRDDEWRGQSITLLEFYPTVLAVSVWADSVSNKSFRFIQTTGRWQISSIPRHSKTQRS